MKKNILIALFAAAAVAPIAAQAQSYVGVNVGRTNLKATMDGESGKDHATAAKLYGGYQFTPMFGIEAGIANLGKLEEDGITVKANSFYVAATGTWQLAERLALIAKVGAANTKVKVDITGFGSGSEKKTTALIGVGVAYSITPTVQAVAEYENFGKVLSEDGANVKASVLSAGVRVQF